MASTPTLKYLPLSKYQWCHDDIIGILTSIFMNGNTWGFSGSSSTCDSTFAFYRGLQVGWGRESLHDQTRHHTTIARLFKCGHLCKHHFFLTPSTYMQSSVKSCLCAVLSAWNSSYNHLLCYVYCMQHKSCLIRKWYPQVVAATLGCNTRVA